MARWPTGSHAFGILARRVRVRDFLASMQHPEAGMIPRWAHIEMQAQDSGLCAESFTRPQKMLAGMSIGMRFTGFHVSCHETQTPCSF